MADSDGMDCDVDSLCAGLSKILLTRGDRYSVDSGIRRLELEERWSWESRSSYDSTRYLDASCLVFGAGRQFLEAVDYQSKRNTGRSGGEGAIRHSGDLLRSALCEGTHTVSVDLDRLSSEVSELFICLSAWAGARLGEIRAPSVTLVDPDAAAAARKSDTGGYGNGKDDEGNERTATAGALCEYRLEGVSKADLDRYSSVVMCRVYRDTGASPTAALNAGGFGAGAVNAFSSGGSTPVGGGDADADSSSRLAASASPFSRSQWRVEAIGQLGHGHADNYEPLLGTIRNELSLADSLAGWKV
jgi:stress response protein SCP2